MDADPPEKRGRPAWDGEVTDIRTRSGPSGYWARHVGRVNRVIGGGPLGTRVAASASPQGDGAGGSRGGAYDRWGRVTPAEGKTLAFGGLVVGGDGPRLGASLQTNQLNLEPSGQAAAPPQDGRAHGKP